MKFKLLAPVCLFSLMAAIASPLLAAAEDLIEVTIKIGDREAETSELTLAQLEEVLKGAGLSGRALEETLSTASEEGELFIEGQVNVPAASN